MKGSIDSYPPMSLSWLIWAAAALFYITGFYQRVAPSVLTDLLMRDFQIGAAALGNLSAFYFYSYVAMQIPTGVMIDRWGARKLLCIGAVLSSFGILIFALAPAVAWANAGRFLVGGSVAVAWVALLNLSARWFPPDRFATVTGIALCAGVIGALAAGMPLRYLVENFSWRLVFVFSALVTLVLGASVWWFVRDDPQEKGFRSYAPAAARGETSPVRLTTAVGEVFSYRNSWLVTFAPGGISGPVLAFTGLWGVPFLVTQYGFTPKQAAALTSTLLVAWALGGPFMGAISDRLGKRRPVYLTGAGLAAASWMGIVFIPNLPTPLLVTLLITVGFASGVMVLGFAFLRESVPSRLGGTASGVCNAGSMMGPMALQPAVGLILDWQWDGLIANGVRIYGATAWQYGMGILVAAAVMSFIFLLFTEETYCRPLESRGQIQK